MDNEPGDDTVETGAEADEAFVKLGQHFHVNSGLCVKAFKLGNAGEFHQVLIAGVVHGQQDDVVGLGGGGGVFIAAFPGGDIKLAANDGFNPLCPGLEVKFQGAIHGTMVGHGHGIHSKLFALSKEVWNTNGSIKETVLGVDVEVGESCCHG